MASNQRTVISGGDVDQQILYLKVIVIQAMINFHLFGFLCRFWGVVVCGWVVWLFACGWAARQLASDRPNPAGMSSRRAGLSITRAQTIKTREQRELKVARRSAICAGGCDQMCFDARVQGTAM